MHRTESNTKLFVFSKSFIKMLINSPQNSLVHKQICPYNQCPNPIQTCTLFQQSMQKLKNQCKIITNFCLLYTYNCTFLRICNVNKHSFKQLHGGNLAQKLIISQVSLITNVCLIFLVFNIWL